MLRVGLTGGIGAGKSAVAARLEQRGAVLIDADRLAREVVAPGTDGLALVVSEFGRGVMGDSGELDRERLADIVFADPSARSRLEAIVHPLVRRRTEQRFAAAPADAVVVNDVPLLVEAGLAPTYHLIVVVEADPKLRRARLVGRGMPAAAAAARITAQATDEQRRAVADALLDNSEGFAVLHEAVDALWERRLLEFERRLRHRSPCPLPEQTGLATGRDWRARFARTAARIRHALAADLDRVDHVGSTAVPQLPAREILDVQVVVRDQAALNRASEALAGLGLPPLPAGSSAAPAQAPAGVCGEAEGRLHGSADPGQSVRLRLLPVGSPAWRAALRVRDWLRADPEARQEYASLKQRLTMGDGAGGIQYARATAGWLAGATTRATAWAAATGWHAERAGGE